MSQVVTYLHVVYMHRSQRDRPELIHESLNYLLASLEDARDVTRAKDMQDDEFEAKAQVSALKLATNLSRQSIGKAKQKIREVRG